MYVCMKLCTYVSITYVCLCIHACICESTYVISMYVRMYVYLFHISREYEPEVLMMLVPDLLPWNLSIYV